MTEIINYKKLTTACAICAEFMCTEYEDGSRDLYCTEYNSEFPITKSVKKCSSFALRHIKKEDMNRKEIRKIEDYFFLDTEKEFMEK